MVALVFLLLGILVGLAGGGSVERIAVLRLRGESVLLLAFIVQAIARGRVFGTAASALGMSVWVAASIVIVVLLSRSWRIPGALVCSAGTLLNLVVVLANGNMPVVGARITQAMLSEVSSTSGGFYGVAHVGTLASWAGDVIPLSTLGQSYLMSAGDVLLGVGVATIIAAAMLNVPNALILVTAQQSEA